MLIVIVEWKDVDQIFFTKKFYTIFQKWNDRKSKSNIEMSVELFFDLKGEFDLYWKEKGFFVMHFPLLFLVKLSATILSNKMCKYYLCKKNVDIIWN